MNQKESLLPRERSARQRVTELMSVMESEKSQGSVLKAILHAKETKQIEGIHGRLGDLGAIDGKKIFLFLYILFIQEIWFVSVEELFGSSSHICLVGCGFHSSYTFYCNLPFHDYTYVCSL